MIDFARILDLDALKARLRSAPRDASGGIVGESAEGIALDILKESITREVLSLGLSLSVSHVAVNFADALPPEQAEIRQLAAEALDASLFAVDLLLEAVRIFGRRVGYDLDGFAADLRAMHFVAMAFEKAGPDAVDRGRQLCIDRGMTLYDLDAERFADVWAEAFAEHVEILRGG